MPLAAVVLEPDKPFKEVGRWVVSTARWGVGCVAVLPYSDNDHEVSLSSESGEEVTLAITFNPAAVGMTAAEVLESVHVPEIVLGRKRWTASPWEYRDSIGMLTDLGSREALGFLKNGITLKLTENGSEKLQVRVENIGDALSALRKCLTATR